MFSPERHFALSDPSVGKMRCVEDTGNVCVYVWVCVCAYTSGCMCEQKDVVR